MRKIYFLFSGLFFFLFVNAQVEQLYDFNGLELGNLDGQDGWKTIKQVNGNDDFQVNLSGDGIVSPDGTNAVFYWFGGPGVGRTATRKSQPDFTIDFQEGGVYAYKRAADAQRCILIGASKLSPRLSNLFS